MGIPIGQLQYPGLFAVTESFINAVSPSNPGGALYAFPQHNLHLRRPLQAGFPPHAALVRRGVHGDFSNDRRLSKEEIDTIAAWVDGGAKEGDAKDAPAPLAFAEGWAMGKPDAVIEMAAAYDVPAAGTVEYTYFVVPTGFTEDK